MIQKVFDLSDLKEESYTEGITSFKPKSTVVLKDQLIVDSRGEFTGYLSIPGELMLFRDRVGGRNLYYARIGVTLYVSTDILWLVSKKSGGLASEHRLNLEYISKDYLEFQVPFNDETIYRGISKVMPGEIVSFSRNFLSREIERTKIKYWNLKFGENKFNKDDLLDLIIDAVNWRKELLKEGKYTSYLSGGIDSSSITILSNPEESFSGFYEHEQYSELDYIKCLERRFKPVKINEDRFYRFLPHLPELMPDPMGGLGVIPQLIVAMEAFRGGYHYAFTGEGGDEIFTGYNWNTAVFLLARAVRDVKRDCYMVRYESMVDRILQEGFGPLVAGLIGRGYNKNYQVERILSIWDKDQSVENNIFKINVEIGLPAILTVDERVGIYSSVMPVSPLVDYHIIEYVASISPEERTRIPKYLFREAMKKILPDKIRERRDKMGFPLPVEEWKWPMIPELLSSLRKRCLVNFEAINYSELIMNRRLWALCNIELICRRLESE